MSRFDPDREISRHNHVFGALVALACVMGLAGMMWLHTDQTALLDAETALFATPAPTPAGGNPAFLHAPATDPSVPSADQVFAFDQGASEPAPAAPTF